MLRDWFDSVRERISAIVGPPLRAATNRVGILVAPYARQAGAQIKPYYDQARSRFQKLEPRERLLVQIAAGLVGALAVYNFVYLPIVNIGDDLQQKIIQRRVDLIQVRHLAMTYIDLKADLAQAEHHTVPLSRDFALFSVVETAMTKSFGRDKIAAIVPDPPRKVSDSFTEFSVKLSLSNVTLQQVVDALYGISSLPVPVGIDDLHIQRRTPDTHSFDVNMTCVALARNG
ncbi:MAG TPA: type II secretion system protein GspM [Candidatus Binataceae bacterium]|nr:type II secretion system protein GspM [Candidatus Binataceae bacterium]